MCFSFGPSFQLLNNVYKKIIVICMQKFSDKGGITAFFLNFNNEKLETTFNKGLNK